MSSTCPPRETTARQYIDAATLVVQSSEHRVLHAVIGCPAPLHLVRGSDIYVPSKPLRCDLALFLSCWYGVYVDACIKASIPSPSYLRLFPCSIALPLCCCPRLRLLSLGHLFSPRSILSGLLFRLHHLSDLLTLLVDDFRAPCGTNL